MAIGPINLYDFEIPTSIRFGGRQKLVTHRTSNGTRFIEPLGPDDSKICFEGIFSGAPAEARARELNNLRLSGAHVWLTWQSFRYKIIVEEFTATYNSRWWIPYRVSCVVVHQSGINASSLLTMQSIVFGALAVAEGALIGSGIDTSALSTAITNRDSLTFGTSANTSAIAAANQAFFMVQASIDSDSALLINSLNDSEFNAGTASTFGAQVGCSESLANAAVARAHIGTIGRNLISLGT
jgi:hypothetical protein